MRTKIDIPERWEQVKIADFSDFVKGMPEGFLLVHQTAAVLWGTWDGKKESWASDRFDEKKIREMRAFCLTEERFAWKEGKEWKARRIVQCADGEFLKAFDEDMFLWGTDSKPGTPGFLEWSEGVQGIHQALPQLGERLPRLKVRQFLSQDPQTFEWRIVAHRLVNLIPGEK